MAAKKPKTSKTISGTSKTKGFTPTPAPVPPSGSYDPSLDASERAANRGLLYSQQDSETAGERASTAYTVGTEQNDTSTGWSLADLLTGKTRTQADLGTSRDRGTVDLATALSRSREDTGRLSADLNRNYAELGAGQTGKAASGAFVDTSSIAAAGAARAGNRGRDQANIDQNETRFEQDNTLAGSRLNEDFTSGIGRSEQDYSSGVGRVNTQHDQTAGGLAQTLQYGVDDRALADSRAGSENTRYGEDVSAARMYQATSSGLYTPPVKPSNEFSDGKGPYRLIVAHGLRFKERPNGTREPAGVAR